MAPEWNTVRYDACVQNGFDVNLSYIFGYVNKTLL